MELISQLSILLPVIIAALLGGAIGIEREFSRKPAGVRTHMFVAAAAASFMVIGNYLFDYFVIMHPYAAFQGDPIRIIQTIVVGFSFLGAGVIFKDVESANIRNLTTATSVLVTTAVGMAVAIGLVYFAAGLTMFVLFVNIFVIKVEKNLVPKKYRDDK